MLTSTDTYLSLVSAERITQECDTKVISGEVWGGVPIFFMQIQLVHLVLTDIEGVVYHNLRQIADSTHAVWY